MYAPQRAKTTVQSGWRYSVRILPIVTYVAAVCASGWIARFDLRTNNTRGVVFAVLLTAFACSALEARYATLWALLAGFAVPIAETYSAAVGAPRPGLGVPTAWATLTFITLAIGFTGSAIGVLFHKMSRG